ncbi:hypothetical protein DBR32_15235, partial [Taibaiella sp. KBW10]
MINKFGVLTKCISIVAEGFIIKYISNLILGFGELFQPYKKSVCLMGTDKVTVWEWECVWAMVCVGIAWFLVEVLVFLRSWYKSKKRASL